VAQKRQRSKQRQAERRAQRLSERGGDGAADEHAREVARQRDPERQELEEQIDLQVGAPPEELGHSDFTTRHEEPPPPDFETDDDELLDAGDGDLTRGPRATGPRGVRGGGDRAASAGESTKDRGGARVIEFLKAVWAELQRVQWPNRRQLTQLTGVVLFFVLIVGAYLGALDAVLSKIIQQIL
jgi:preprotein translocase SecE subunit